MKTRTRAVVACIQLLLPLLASLPVWSAEADPTLPAAPAAAAPDDTTSTKVAAKHDPLPLDELRAFAEVLERIRTAYVRPIDDKTLLKNAIRGMLHNLDPHSAYLDAEQNRSLLESATGHFGGIGIEVGFSDDRIIIVTPIDDSPAARAGLQAGDIITHIDGTPVKGTTVAETIQKVRGEPGAPIQISVLRRDEGAKVFNLARAKIPITSVRGKLLERDYGYLRVSQFQATTAPELLAALATVTAANSGDKLAGLVLDLRNNPGGVLEASVQIADAFLDEGLIVYTEGRLPEAIRRYSATPGDVTDGTPLIVLINGGSASASEVVAGALQDHRRALVLGTTSFGKGSVQTVLPLTEGRAIKLTTSRYFTPNGRSIQAQGIQPDIVVAATDTPASAEAKGGAGDTNRRERDLPGHLAASVLPPSTSTSQYSGSDAQVIEALNLLKGINILGRAQND